MKNKHKSSVWQMQEAKAMLSEVVYAAESAPQYITVRGEKKAVVLSLGDYEKTRPKMSVYEFFRNSPLYGVELDIPERRVEPARELDL